MNDLLETIFRFDAAGHYHDAIRHLREDRISAAIPHEVYQLLFQSRFLEAHVLAQLARGQGVTNPILAFAQAVGGFLFGNNGEEVPVTAVLAAMVDALPKEQKDVIANAIVHPIISQVILADYSIVRDHPRALRILEIYKAGSPVFRSIFNWEDEATALHVEDLRRQGRARARLITFADPPTGAPRKPWRAIVAMRKLIFPSNPESRLFDMGPRMESAMNAYGWRASHFGMRFDYQENFAALAEFCVQENADILFLDDYQIQVEASHNERAALIAGLRQKLPNLKVVAVYLDPWAIDASVLIKTSTQLDAIWAHFPANPVWSEPALADKIMTVPFPHAGNFGESTAPLSSRMKFVGGIFKYNWYRTMWLAGVLHGLPVEAEMSTHMADGLSVLDSYVDYMGRIEASTCVLNFSMRQDMSRIITGRSFETILAGALLVQEDAPDMDSYFVAGEHYLNFSTVPQLRAIARFIAERPEEAEEIRRAGNAFARARYGDDKLIGYLDKQLFYRD